MKVYICCDIEGVAGLSSWEEARTNQLGYQEAARQMSLEAAAAARGALSAGADVVIIEDGHGDGRNIDINLLPSGVQLIRGITHDLFGSTGAFDSSFDALVMIGFHDAASHDGNPTSHTIVSAKVASLYVNDEIWGEYEVSAYGAARIGVPTVFLSGDDATCKSAEKKIPGIITVSTKKGLGYSVLSKTPEDAVNEIELKTKEALCRSALPAVLEMPAEFKVEINYLHHYDAKNASHFPGVEQISPCSIRFVTNDFLEVLRLLYYVL